MSRTPSIESMLRNVKRAMRENGVRKPSNADAIKMLKDGLPLLKLMVEDPHGPEADRELDAVVARYNEQAFEAVAAEGLILHPRWPVWHRLLQVRFVQLACAESASIAALVRELLEGSERPSPNRLMREVFRQCLIETIGWGKANKDLPASRQAPRPKTMKDLWDEAWRQLDDDMGRESRHGRTIESAPAEWYAILGTDYSLQSVPN